MTFNESVRALLETAPRWLPLDQVPDGTLVYGPATAASLLDMAAVGTPRVVTRKLRQRFGTRTLWLVGYLVSQFKPGQAVIWARPAGCHVRPVAARLVENHNARGQATIALWDVYLKRVRTLRVPVAHLAKPQDPLPADWPSVLLPEMENE